jgi:hypothetical protein
MKHGNANTHPRASLPHPRTTVGRCLSSARDSIWPSFRAAPRILHRAAARRSALASVMTMLPAPVDAPVARATHSPTDPAARLAACQHARTRTHTQTCGGYVDQCGGYGLAWVRAVRGVGRSGGVGGWVTLPRDGHGELTKVPNCHARDTGPEGTDASRNFRVGALLWELQPWGRGGGRGTTTRAEGGTACSHTTSSAAWWVWWAVGTAAAPAPAPAPGPATPGDADDPEAT